jgi:methyl-accepting chemotaxis protein
VILRIPKRSPINGFAGQFVVGAVCGGCAGWPISLPAVGSALGGAGASRLGTVNEAIDLYRTTSQAAYDSVNDSLDRVTRLNVSSATAASDQADAAYRNSRLLIVVAMTVAAILVMIALAYVRRFISTPLLELARGMRRLAGNKTDIEIPGTERVDEIGEMARALVVFRTNAIELILSQRSLAQQTSMLEEKLAQEQRLTQLQQDFVSMATMLRCRCRMREWGSRKRTSPTSSAATTAAATRRTNSARR